MKKLKFALPFLAGIIFFLGSCSKDNTSAPTFTTVQDDAYAESIFDNVTSLTNEAYDLSSTNFKSTEGRVFLSDCATVSLDTTAFPRVLTIDFGDTNCLGNDGRYRRGKILVSFTGRYRKPGTIITTTFDNYYVNDNQVEGTKAVTNNGFNDERHMTWTISVNGVITLANGKGTITWKSQRTREWVKGIDTPHNRGDDVYLITGQASGERANGLKWTRKITNPLRMELACRFIVSGTVEIKPEGKPMRTLDFGDGECDNLATVTVNGKTYTIHLRP
ncbi:MAG: hypothetical protein IEMM0006_0003 [bacterium]|nr:MAG: hypothetical protein IEMM0006_0003 [bacterium]